MSRRQRSPVSVSADVLILEAQVRSYFSNMQAIYNASQETDTPESLKAFLSKSANISTLRTEFVQLVKELNVARINEDSEYEPNFQSLIAFEELFSAVQYKLNEHSTLAKSPLKPSPATPAKPKIKLPPINLPKFNGDSKQWTVFYECYNNTIHNNKELSNSEKLHYLLGQLSESALTSIAGIEPTGDNYTLIYTTLTDKYQDVRALGYTYLDQVYNFKQLQSSQNLNSFLDVCATSIAAFEKLNIKNKTDFIYLYLCLKKIDKETAHLYENYMRSEKLPSFDNFIKYIKEQAKINERTPPCSHAQNEINSRQRKFPSPKNIKSTATTKTFVTSVESNKTLCPLCKNDTHKQFYRCPKFLKLTPQERYNVVKSNSACVSCLSFFHTKSLCKSDKTCVSCGSNSHHSYLHFIPSGNKVENSSASTDTSEKPSQGQIAVSLCSLDSQTPVHTTVLLSTATVRALDSKGKEYKLKCLIDNASQHNYITSDCVKRLGLTQNKLSQSMTVSGFGGQSSTTKGISRITIFSRLSKISYSVEPLIVDKITDRLPTSPVENSLLTYLASVPLADDTYHLPSKIDMILGAQMFTKIILSGRVAAPPGMPIALETTLGFILMGDAPLAQPACTTRTQTLCAISNERLSETLRNFFELEEVPAAKNTLLSAEEQECESIYQATTERDSHGRYIVALPFKSDPTVLGNASQNAKKRFNYLERKLETSPLLRDAYNNIIDEYLEKDYLAPVLQNDCDLQYVIPHHGVQRNDKVTTKLRLVLDASATENNMSLNSLLHKGPNLQSDLFMLLLNFRLFKIAICADIKQMYLQLKVHPEFWKFQRIFYRFCKNDPLELFEFKRVCFGLASSPFLALRTLQKLAEDEGSKYPLAAAVINDGQFYMDDVICTTHTVEEAIELANQLSNLFASGCFDLLKWSSNSSQFLAHYPKDLLHPSLAVSFEPESSQRVLGIKWVPSKDAFTFDFAPKGLKCTKRNMLSVIAQLFDVLGFVAPVILYAKLLIKELWLEKIDWDNEPPTHIQQSWSKFQDELHVLSELSIPRHVGITRDCVITLAAFSDASEKAYGAVLYVHTKTPDGIFTNLLCAKSKVAPVKTVSLARLELCAAHLLSKLVRAVVTNFGSRISIARIYAFSDSTVALNWINSIPHKLKTFVANRVSKIQNNLPPENFFHVSGKENPSDCLSRGLTPAQLISHPLWFNGPEWMRTDTNDWPIKRFTPNLDDLPESKTIALNNVTPEKQLILAIAERISNWSKLLRIFVYILRFSKRLKTRGLITAEDLDTSELFIIRSLQNVHFSEYIVALNKGTALPRNIIKLRPVLIDGIIRVGGRLSACDDISFDQKYPILLPKKDHIVNLIIEHTHRVNCHAGPQLTISLLRKKYWILSARRIVRARIHACVPCFKVRPISYQAPVMADIPSCRLDISKPFAHTGIDYCGLFYVTPTRGRGIKSLKAYVCVFICLTTRAVHVEVAPDLTTESFLNNLKKFLSRRGPIQRIWSDHGGNFQCAKSYLNEVYEFLNTTYDDAFKAELAKNRISWTMIPPNAPHFGGSWESTVKSFKTHLRRTIGSQILTYDELQTVLCQIEALLNSRPLGILSEDPSEPFPITPAHFLNTTPLKVMPAIDVTNENSHLLTRFSLLDQLVQSYWKRWREEYLQTLQVRAKWNTESRPVEVGTIVLIMNQNCAPLHWPLGKIEKVFVGPDGRIRVALVKTKTGTLKRPVIRLCPLPLNVN